MHPYFLIFDNSNDGHNFYSVLILISLKLIIENSKNGRCPFKEFSRLRVNYSTVLIYLHWS